MVEQTEKFNSPGIKTEFVGEALHSKYRNMSLSHQYKDHLVIDEAHCIRTWNVNAKMSMLYNVIL